MQIEKQIDPKIKVQVTTKEHFQQIKMMIRKMNMSLKEREKVKKKWVVI